MSASDWATSASPYHFVSHAKLPTAHGEFIIHAFENEAGQEHVMLTKGLPAQTDITPLVRIHSECLTGDAFSSLKCDCGPQLNATMQAIQAHGCGAILYLRQEGRGIGLVNKIRAYALQDQGHDTLDANLILGLPADARTYEMCKPMLEHVGIKKLKLLTNNPNKLHYLESLGFEIVERVPLIVGVNPLNANYLMTKQSRMGHLLGDEPLADGDATPRPPANNSLASHLTTATFNAIPQKTPKADSPTTQSPLPNEPISTTTTPTKHQ